MFNKGQDAFVQLKNILAESTTPVYLWIGAGLSTNAGMPSWQELRQNLVARARRFLQFQDESKDRNSREIKIKLAEAEEDLWTAFEYIHEAVGDAEFDQEIISEFEHANTCPIPEAYKVLLGLNVKGVITTNIDKLVTRALIESGNGVVPVEFYGYECDPYHHVLNSSKFFILHLHGFVENRSSWVLRRKELSKLLCDEGYNRFVQTIFYERTIVFIGVNPMDEAVVVHLRKVHEGRGSTPLFWLTSDTSAQALQFCDQYNIRRIVYASDDRHRELVELVSELRGAKSFDDVITRPVIYNIPPVRSSTRNLSIDGLRGMSIDEVRDVLNKKAFEILESKNAEAYAVYEKFLKEYRQQIHNAWFVEPGSRLLGWNITEEIGDGAFGRVFKAENDKGDVCAVKLLKLDVMRKPECLQSFRRGVRAMQILQKRKLPGVVRYKFSSEVPAFVAMDYVEGASLYDVVKAKRLGRWRDKLKVLTTASKIIKSAHALPERVLHRDIRPHNIILRGYDYNSDDWEVCVLDFDLAFHKDANEVSMQMASGVNGFLAPEQTDSKGKASLRRNCRVDSYGFAMLCYFVISGETPRPDQCLQVGWHDSIQKYVSSQRCDVWESLPYRIGKMIEVSTSRTQSERMDLYEMHNRLVALQEAYQSPDSVRDPDLVVDEIVIRIANRLKILGEINRDIDGRVRIDRPNGEIVQLMQDGKSVFIEMAWHNLGNVDIAKVRSALQEKACAVSGKIKKAGLEHSSFRSDMSGVVVETSWSVSNFSIAKLKAIVEIIAGNSLAPKIY